MSFFGWNSIGDDVYVLFTHSSMGIHGHNRQMIECCIGGKISKQANQMRLEVTDSGPGIPDTAQKRLFTKFYRVERTLTSGNRGTGLGLFIPKTIIDLHDGIIGLSSKVGQGTTFYFMLPLYNEENVAIETSNCKELLGDHGWITKRTDS